MAKRVPFEGCQIAIIVTGPGLALDDLEALNAFAERAFGKPASELFIDTGLSHDLNHNGVVHVVMAITEKPRVPRV